jgi:formate hydrogenlyase subunit 3/multisubunit Na+/H+ antiporter MnhD subunit
MSMGLALARERLPDDTFASLSSLAWRRPWAAVVLIIGAFSLAGVPPFAGFAGRWAALQQVSGNDFGAAAALLIGTIGVVGGTLRGLQFIMRPSQEPLEGDMGSESFLTVALLIGALALCLLFGLFPDLMTPAIRHMAVSFSIAP